MLRKAWSLLVLMLVSVTPTFADENPEPILFRIGSGGVGGTYYPVSYLLASSISNPPGARKCEDGGSCGVPNLIAVPQSSNGSVANIKAIQNGTLESGLVQSDIAHWGYYGTGIFEGQRRHNKLRALSSLYSETVHVVVRRDSGIRSISDLRGKRVSLDEPGSGTLVDARHILAAYGIPEEELRTVYVKPNLAIEKMRRKELDAFVVVVGYPSKAITKLTQSTDISLLPIEGGGRTSLLKNFRFFDTNTIPAGTYPGVPDTKTLSVTAIWTVSSEVEGDTVYEMMRAMWHPTARKLFDQGHRQGKEIRLISALNGVAIPLHTGALRFYQEQNMVKTIARPR